VEEHVYVHKEKSKKCSCFFWILVLLAAALLIFVILHFVISHTKNRNAKGKTNGNSQQSNQGSGGNSGGNSGGSGFHPVKPGQRYRWDWVNHDGTENNYSDGVSWLLEECQRNGIPSFLIDIGNDRIFEVDVQEKLQHNLKWVPGHRSWFLTWVPGHHEVDSDNKYIRCEAEVKAPRVIKRVEIDGDANERFTPEHHWEWKNKSGEWKPYSRPVSDWMEYCFEKDVHNREPIFDIGQDIMFQADLRKKLQRSLVWKDGSHRSSTSGSYSTSKITREMRRVEGESPNSNNHQQIRIILADLS